MMPAVVVNPAFDRRRHDQIRPPCLGKHPLAELERADGVERHEGAGRDAEVT